MTDDELVRWVAENVMGWHMHPDYNYWLNAHNHTVFPITQIEGDNGYQPLTNLNHAFMVVQKMIDEGYHCRLESDDRTGKWLVDFRKKRHMQTELCGYATKTNLGHAVCLAFLKTMGVEVEDDGT